MSYTWSRWVSHYSEANCSVSGWMHIEIGHDVTLRRNCTSNQNLTCCMHFLKIINTDVLKKIVERFSRAGPRGRGREWATLGVHPLSWLLSNNRLEKVPVVSVPHISSNQLLLSNQDKRCTPSVAHSLPLPLGPPLLNLWNISILKQIVWETQKWHYIFSRLSGFWVNGKNILINNSRTAWSIKNVDANLGFVRQCASGCFITSQTSVDNFEIVHKTCST